MPMNSDVVANLYNGVSEQAPELRSPSQAEEQINMDSSLAHGLMKRPPAEWIAEYRDPGFSGTGSGIFTHLIETAEDAFMLIADGTQISIKRCSDGSDCAITYKTAAGATSSSMGGYFLPGSRSPRECYKASAVADTTFLFVTSQLCDWVTTSGSATPTEVQRFADLPDPGVSGALYKITGTDYDAFASYYVEWNGAAYVETNDGFTVNAILNAPWKVYQTAELAFTIEEISFVYPDVGSEETNPLPVFAGTQIYDMFFYRNRLGILTNKGFALSRAGDYYNFFRRTATAVLDDDPINYFVAHTKTFNLYHAIPFDRSLFLFGDTVQFELSGGDILSPRTVRVDPVMEYEVARFVRPVIMGRRMYFAQPDGSYTRIREYYIDSDTVSAEASDITAHCPTYLKGTPRHLSASSIRNTLSVVTSEPRTIYNYRVQFEENRQRSQSSWSKYDLGSAYGSLAGTHHTNDSMYFLGCGIGDIGFRMWATLHKIQYDPSRVDVTNSSGGWRVHLDRMIYATVASNAFDAERDVTELTLPYTTYALDEILIVDAETGEAAPVTATGDYTATAEGNWQGKTVFLGGIYRSAYELSQIFAKDNNQRPMLTGRLQLKRLVVSLRHSGALNIETTYTGRPTDINSWTADRIGEVVIGEPSVADGRVSMSLMGGSEETNLRFTSDSHLPLRVISYQWGGEYQPYSL